nr:hypothetical protein GCM10025732_03170 [Glycomyces mayteni]
MSETVLFANAAVLDTAAGVLVAGQRVLVRGGEIAAVGSEVEAAGARVVDLGGRTLMPGLIDCHVHVNAHTADLAGLGDQSPAYVAVKAAIELREMLHRGFTTVRDPGGADFGIHDAVAEGLIDGPRVFFGGKALSQTGGHVDMRPRGRAVSDGHHCCPDLGLVCDGVDGVRKAAREQLRTGAHHVKIMLSGGVASPPTGSTRPSSRSRRSARSWRRRRPPTGTSPGTPTPRGPSTGAWRRACGPSSTGTSSTGPASTCSWSTTRSWCPRW